MSLRALKSALSEGAGCGCLLVTILATWGVLGFGAWGVVELFG